MHRLISKIFRDRVPRGPHMQVGALDTIPEVLVVLMLGAHSTDGIDAAIDSRATRLGKLPRDIRGCIRELLWEGDSYCGIRHRGCYRYGVRNGGDTPWVIFRPDGRPIAKLYYTMGLLHREDGPALIACDEHTTKYYRHGRVHRDAGPAIMYYDSIIHWMHSEHYPTVGVCSIATNNRHMEIGVRGVSLSVHDDHIACRFYADKTCHKLQLYEDRAIADSTEIRSPVMTLLYEYLRTTVATLNPRGILAAEYSIIGPIIDDLFYGRLGPHHRWEQGEG